MAYESRLELTIDSTTGEKRLKSFNKQLKGTEKAGHLAASATRLAAGGIMAMAGVAATGSIALAALTRQGMNSVDEQAKLARQLDSTIGGLRGLQLAANDAGVATGTVNSNMETLSARLGEAVRGSGQALEMLDRLGLSADVLAGSDVDDRVAMIADRVQDLGLSGAETADVLRQLGIRNREMVNLLRQGGDPIRQARQEVEDYGLAISSIDAAVIEAANDALSRTGLLLESTRTALAVEMSPVILEVAGRFNDAAREVGGMDQAIRLAVESGVTSMAGLADGTAQMWTHVKRGELVLADMDYAFARFAHSSWGHVGGFLDSWSGGLNNIIGMMNSIPGMGGIEEVALFSDGKFMDSIQRNLETALGNRNLAQLDFNAAEAILPSQYIDEFFDDVEKRRQKIIEQAGNGEFVGSLTPSLGDTAKALEGAQKEAVLFSDSLQSIQDRLFPLEASQRNYRDDQELLTMAWAKGEIGVMRYLDALNRLQQAQLSTQTASQAYGQGFGSEIGSRGVVGAPTDPLAGIGGNQDQDYWQKWLDSAETAFTDFDQLAANTAENFQRGFGNAFESMIFDSQSFGDAMYNLTDGIARSMVNALGQMAGQWLAYQAVQMATGRSMEAAAVAGAAATGSSIAAAYAPAAAAASLASFGANAAPAATGIASTFALTKTLSLSGMAHDGIDSVPREGTWLLDKGERVMNRPQADRLDNYLDRQEGRKGTNGDVNITYAPVINAEAGPGATEGDALRFAKGINSHIKSEFYAMVRKEQRPGGVLAKR